MRAQQTEAASTLLAQDPSVEALEIVPRETVEDLLEPWLGSDNPEDTVPIPALMKLLYDKGCAVPYRADHAPGMYGHDANFGYGLVARAQGLSYLQGILRGLGA